MVLCLQWGFLATAKLRVPRRSGRTLRQKSGFFSPGFFSPRSPLVFSILLPFSIVRVTKMARSISQDKVFAVMHDGSGGITYGEMASKRDQIAYSLSKRLPHNIVSGAIYSKNSVAWCLSREVCTAMGLRLSPINWYGLSLSYRSFSLYRIHRHLVADEISYIVDDCDADVVFFGVDFLGNIPAIQAKASKVKAWVCMDAIVDGFLSLEELMQEAPEGAKAPPHNRKGGSIGYTGGTTGKPKGAVRAAAAGADPKRNMATVKEWGLGRMMPQPVQLVAAPLYHAMPTAWLGIGTALGSTFVLMPKFDAEATLAAIQQHRVNGFYMPPILLKRLLQLPASVKSQYDTSSVKTIMSSGAACPASVKEGIFAEFGPVLHELYGASELGAVAVMSPEHMLRKPKSCGKPAYGVTIMVVDEHKKKIEQPGVAGEIYATSEMNIKGYHKQEAKTEESKLGDYFSVGDVGYFDDEGFLYITDRKIDMVVSGGVNIYPAQVEEVLQNHPGLADVAVFGVPDSEYGERVHAALKVVPGGSVTAKSVLAWCDGKIGKFQLPKEADISFHAEDFPRSEAGKLRKKVLREQVLTGSVKSKL